MIRFLRPLALAAALMLAASPASAQRKRPEPPPAPKPAPLPPDIRVRSELSQSAAWVGDPLDFIVEIDTAPGVEIVAEDLMPEKLVLEGLELGPSTSTTTPRADGWRTLRYTYRVVAWDTTPPKKISDLTIRFRRPVTAATADGTAPAADVKVSGATLAMRSTLPDDGSADGTRDRRASLPVPAWLGWIRPVGLGFIALGIAPVILWVGHPHPPPPGVEAAALDAVAPCVVEVAVRRAADYRHLERGRPAPRLRSHRHRCARVCDAGRGAAGDRAHTRRAADPPLQFEAPRRPRGVRHPGGV